MGYHSPVMLEEAVTGLNIKNDGVYVDVTFGGGGHSKEILRQLGPEGKLIAFDQDKDAILNTIEDSRFILINENFKFMKRFLKFHNINIVDGVLADFGVSSHQFDKPERGFSIRFDSYLDMRMDQEASVSAKTIINEYEESDLKNIFKNYGELRIAPAIARSIVEARTRRPIETSLQLRKILERYLTRGRQNKTLAQIYQAIRIEVNKEIECLKELLLCGLKLLKPKGRIVVISYHSVEDRIVKNFFRYGGFNSFPQSGIYKNEPSPFSVITKKPIKACLKEIEINNRARSARLRIAQLK